MRALAYSTGEGAPGDISVLASLAQERAKRARRAYMRYCLSRTLGVARALAFIGAGLWCYSARAELQTILVDLLTP
jgi:hypothetical protein